MRGAFIVIEGCDRSGKSTQCKLLVEKLKENGLPTQLIIFPDRTSEIGKLIHNYLQQNVDLSDQAIHLLFTANRWELEPKIKKYLEEGITVICDRYSYSGVAYSASKSGNCMSVDWLKSPESGLPKPDMVFYLNLSMEVIMKRKGFGVERYETIEFQKSVKKCFDLLKDESWEIIDADKTSEELSEEILKKSMICIRESETKLLSRLW